MKIGIHHREEGFSTRWISYCERKGIEYKIVDCYNNDIINQLSDCQALMWHHSQTNYKDLLFAKQLIFSLQQSGIRVFPDFNSCWHFDDKLGQKYLLESIGAPIVPTYIFYSRDEALNWIKDATFPIVFKLRGGAGSENVRLVRSKSKARNLINIAFNKGFPAFNTLQNIKERIRKFKEGKGTIFSIIKGYIRLIIPQYSSKMRPNEKGYIYFQDFIPNNNFDIRVIIIAEKAFAIKRIVRKNDFRASGSGNILYEKDNFTLETIKLSFLISARLKTQCIAFDFVFDINKKPLIVEISYGFFQNVYNDCVGYWDNELNFHPGSFTPQDWMVEILMK